MEFLKKLKTRLYLGIAYMLLGIIMIAGGIILKTDNEFVSSFGLVLFVLGVVRIRNYFLITRNAENIEKQRIAETDERNIAIINKARSITFITYILGLALAIIILSFLKMQDIARILSILLFLLILIYWIAYFIIRKKY